MDCSGLIFFLFAIFLHPAFTSAQTKFSCSDRGNYTIDSRYQENLNLLLSSLSSNTTTNNGFYNTTVGQIPDKVYGLYLCRGDVTLDACRSCVNTSTQEIIQRCPNQKEAIVWYDPCMLRFSNQSMFSNRLESPNYYLSNGNNISDVEKFDQILGNLMNRLVKQAASATSVKTFAAADARVNSFTTVYGMVQCTPDLSQLDCNICLQGSVRDIPIQFKGKEGARILKPSCNLRYEVYPFINPVAAQPAPSSPPPLTNTTTTTDGKESNSDKIVISVPTAVGVLLLVFIVYFFLRRRKLRKKVEDTSCKDTDATINTDVITTAESLKFDFDTIRAATADFSDANKLGQGGFGAVYKGTLSDGRHIAVKRLSRNSGQGELEFKNEVVLLAKLQHRNLVRLLGFCLDKEERLLVYEFVLNGSLDRFIFDLNKRAQLDWETRYKIIAGIARGLLYLHEDSRLRIIHRDLKASNILLDKDMDPKISDFGMARLFLMDETHGSTNRIVGTYGYMAPEYAMHGQFSVKSDVFSFGVLLLEIVSGRKNACLYQDDSSEDLLSFTWRQWREGTVMELVDPKLKENFSKIEAMRCIHIGLLCVQVNVAERPTMASVTLMLNSYSTTLPLPSEPAFFVDSSTYSGVLSGEYSSQGAKLERSTSESTLLSGNEASITETKPRQKC